MNNCIYLKNRKGKPFCKKLNKEIAFSDCSGCTHKEYKPKKVYRLKQSKKPMKNRSSKLSKACDIPQSVKEVVFNRDKGLCVICKQAGIPNMHYIARSQLGLGIEQNVVCGCIKCHHEYDNGKYRKEYKEIIKKHLQSKYKNWNEEELTYKKY